LKWVDLFEWIVKSEKWIGRQKVKNYTNS
jgi:hypothetical protein